jgi:hypothetical protein
MQKQRDKVIFLRTSQWIRCFLLVLVHSAVRWRPGRPPRPPHRAPSRARVVLPGGRARPGLPEGAAARADRGPPPRGPGAAGSGVGVPC